MRSRGAGSSSRLTVAWTTSPSSVPVSCSGRPVVQAVPLPGAFVEGLQALPNNLFAQFQLPGTQEYLENNTMWNYDAVGSPSAIFVPAHEEELSTFLKFYANNPLPAPHSLSISGGRHSHYGLMNHALVVDMSRFDSMHLDEAQRRGRFGAGVRLGAMDHFNQKHGLATTAGTNPDTGIAGLTLGGGFGHLARRHGLSVDNLVSIRAVLVSGEAVHATRDNEHADLLWACRGGGGNFGVVTEFEFQLHPRPQVISGATVFLTRTFTDVQGVLRQWRDYNQTASRDVSCTAVLPTGGAALVLPTAYVGDDLAEGERLLAPVRRMGKPLIAPFKHVPYAGAAKIGDDLQSSAVENQPAGNWYESGLLLRELSDEAIAILDRCAHGAHVPNKTCQIIVMQLGGAVSDVPEDDAPVGFRAAPYIAMLLGRWDNAKSEAEYVRRRSAVRDWVKMVLAALAPFSLASYNTLGDQALTAQKAEGAGAAAAAAASTSSSSSSVSAAGTSSPSDSSSSSAAVGSASASPIADPGAVLPPLVAGGAPRCVDMKKLSHFSDAQFARLVAIKHKYDPTNVFRNCNNIQPNKA